MEINYKLPLIAGAFLAGSLFCGCDNAKKGEQIQEKSYLLKESMFENKKINYPKFVEKSVEEIMIESEKFPTITHFIYEILKNSQKSFKDVNKLEKIIESVGEQYEKKEKYSKEEAIEILKITDKEIKNLGLVYEENKFDCDDISFIYLAVGEKFNLPLYGVSIPFHFFIRYDSDGKHSSLDSNDSVNKGDFNWETTNGKIVKDNKYCGLGYNIESRTYLKNLTKQELIARVFCRVGDEQEDFNCSIKYYKKSIELDKNNPDSYLHSGLSFFREEEYDSAIEKYNQVIKLDTTNIYAYLNREIAYKFLGKIEKANEDSRKIEELKDAILSK